MKNKKQDKIQALKTIKLSLFVSKFTCVLLLILNIFNYLNNVSLNVSGFLGLCIVMYVIILEKAKQIIEKEL